MNRVPGFSTETLSLIEHSVIRIAVFGEWSRTNAAIAPVDPAKSAAFSTSDGHSGCVMIIASGCSLRSCSISSAVKRSCTSQAPFQVRMRMSVWLATFFARYSSGIMTTVSVPHWRAAASTTWTAFDDVQQISDSALTSAEVLT